MLIDQYFVCVCLLINGVHLHVMIDMSSVIGEVHPLMEWRAKHLICWHEPNISTDKFVRDNVALVYWRHKPTIIFMFLYVIRCKTAGL